MDGFQIAVDGTDAQIYSLRLVIFHKKIFVFPQIFSGESMELVVILFQRARIRDNCVLGQVLILQILFERIKKPL